MSAVSAAQTALEPSFVFEDREITTPVLVERSVSCTAIFLVSASAARRFVTPSGLVLAEVLPGRAAFSLTFTKYVTGDLDAYNEVSMDFLVRHPDEVSSIRYLGDMASFLRSTLPSYVHRRATDQKIAAQADREIWGFSTSLGQISLEPVGTRYQGKLVLGGQRVMTFSVPFGGKRIIPENEKAIYSRVAGDLCQTVVQTSAEKVGVHIGGARLTLGDHPIASELRGLGLPKRAIASVWRGLVHGATEAPIPV